MKNEIRKIALEKRKQLNTDILSGQILKNVFSLKEYTEAENIICYYPLKYEVSTLKLLEDNSKNWFLPRVNGDNLEICKYDKSQMKLGSFNIQEPLTEEITSFDNIDIIILPAVAADRNGYRVGYGKGFYDKFLKSLPQRVIKIIIIFSELLYEDIKPQSFDVKADIIVTDKEILRN